MEEQKAQFDITEDGVMLLSAILEVALDSVAPNWGEKSDLPVEVQETVAQVAGAILIEILRQSGEVSQE